MILVSEVCEKSGFILKIVVNLFKYLRILIPIILIVMIVFDLFKTMTGEIDEKAKKDALNKVVKRILYALIIFLIPTIITFIFKQLEPATHDPSHTDTTSTSWISCWNYYYNQ